MKLIVLVGPPGSGKGTQADNLSREFGIPIFGMGQALRDVAKSETHDADVISRHMGGGDKVPVVLVEKYFRAGMEKYYGSHVVIIDGIPRDYEQGEMIFSFAKDLGARVFTYFIDMPGDKCAANILSGNRGRVDDKPEVVAHRLDVFNRDYHGHLGIKPLKTILRERSTVITIEDGTKDSIYRQIRGSVVELEIIVPGEQKLFA